MESTGGKPSGCPGRWVQILLRCREIDVEVPGGNRETLCYPGVLLISYDHDRKVAETWLPIGSEPTENDDERLIQHLHRALLWQAEAE
ncbi:hypothetical protein [Amycolatopsis anabasis]|uniref:hypothetical protein n=1 Tax=Amycolatopsis anabasis TaxID=1840409 RepID=UPI00131D5538|nr:hypothetical protein [Amycolatopsis anabasis]